MTGSLWFKAIFSEHYRLDNLLPIHFIELGNNKTIQGMDDIQNDPFLTPKPSPPHDLPFWKVFGWS